MSKYLEHSKCTATNRKGDFCDADSHEDMPFPICTRHAVEVYRRMKAIVDAAKEAGQE